MKMQIYKETTSVTFENTYLAYFSKMKYFAKVYIFSEEEAENIVQDVFTELWEKKEILQMQINLAAYLFTATKNRCLNFLRHQSIVREAADEMREAYRLAMEMSLNSLEVFEINEFTPKDISTLIESALNTLPDKCREIFILNKIEGRKQKEIANLLNISVHTVENQVAIAFKKLRKQMVDYYPLLLFLFLS